MPRNVNCKYYTKFANCNHESRKILGFKRSCVKVTDIFAVCDLLETKVEIPDKIPTPPPIPKTKGPYKEKDIVKNTKKKVKTTKIIGYI